MIYADNNATTCVAPEVITEIMPFFHEEYYNPSSAYPAASSVAARLKEARVLISKLLNAPDPGEILFTSCATESNNTAIYGAAHANSARHHIITTTVEHPATLEVCRDLERHGYRVTYLPVNRQGELNIVDYIRALDSDTLLVTIMHANNETGVIFPVGDMARIAKETDPNIIFHTDATQSVTKLPIQLSCTGHESDYTVDSDFRYVDLLSFSGHKFHAPKGVGALYMRRGVKVRPFLVGGHQEQGRRAGTENMAFICGMARAMQLAAETHDADISRMKQYQTYLENELMRRIPYAEINGYGANRMANTTNISCHYVEGESLLFQLAQQGICASSGSACTSGSLEPSHVLRAMNVPFTAVHGSIRFSFSRYSTQSEIEHIIEAFPPIVHNLRRMSPYWDEKTQKPRDNVSL